MEIIKNGVKIVLSDDDVEKIYRHHELEYRIQDAKMHCKEYSNVIFGEGDYKILAKRFIDNYDCNIAENQQWENLIKEYARETWHIKAITTKWGSIVLTREKRIEFLDENSNLIDYKDVSDCSLKECEITLDYFSEELIRGDLNYITFLFQNSVDVILVGVASKESYSQMVQLYGEDYVNKCGNFLLVVKE